MSEVAKRRNAWIFAASVGVAGAIGVLAALAPPMVLAQASAAPKKDESLYKRLGGYDALAAVTDEFITRLVNDPKISRFFNGLSHDSKNRIRQLVVDQLCAATGGPCVYIGRDMKTSHAGLGITEADWQAAITQLTGTLEKFKVPQKEKAEVLAAVGSLKGDIIEKK